MHRMPIEIAMYYVVWLYDGYTVTSYMQSSRSLEHTRGSEAHGMICLCALPTRCTSAGLGFKGLEMAMYMY